jgi:hypothetical protein
MTSRRAVLALLLLTGCPEKPQEQPTGPTADTVCPKDLPRECKVLRDETDTAKNSVDYHVLVPSDTKHDPAQKMLEALYRHIMTRRDAQPAVLSAYLYTSEQQFTTPPPSPVASVVLRSGDKAPTFDNKIPLELWQQVEQALRLDKRFDRKLKRQLTYKADPAESRVSVTIPFTEGASEDWAKELSFLQVMNNFTDTAIALFNNIPDLKVLTFTAQWKDQDVARIELGRADYQRLQIQDIEEKIGSLHGRAFLELTAGKGTDASVAKAHNQRVASEYRKILAALKGHAMVSAAVK